ncbi:hypothetical protein [Halobacillus halophilus]|uniref:hypothetical protein n=1 Tax=Halobacillus halophilus TaxID=1570 RepID=UPI0011AB395D|nr:hypothetical protein [Halobacillus halophilus]
MNFSQFPYCSPCYPSWNTKYKCWDYIKKDSQSIQFDYANEDFTTDAPIPVAPGLTISTVTLTNLKAGSAVSLNGLFLVNNNSATPGSIGVQIYKNSINSANIIYSAEIEIDGAGSDDLGQPIPVLYVDPIKLYEKKATYFLSVYKIDETDNLSVIGQATLTATAYGKATY